jgi:hypothetical protein
MRPQLAVIRLVSLSLEGMSAIIKKPSSQLSKVSILPLEHRTIDSNFAAGNVAE